MLNGHRDIEQSSSNGSFVPSLNSADGGLSIIIGLLDALGIKYWIDSGILLGLARSGAINAWEKDIDLGAVSNEIGRVLKSRKYFIEAGYQVSINRYRGLVYSINLIPAYISSTKNFPVAIHFYYEVGDYLWSPQTQIYMPSPSPDVYSKKRSLIGSFLCGIITRIMYASSSNQKDVHLNGVPKVSGQRKSISKRIIGWLYHKFDKGFLAETWPISEIFVPFTWIIPKQLVLPITQSKFDGKTYQVPSRVNEYLTYRYKNWHIPVTSWCYWVDDGAILRENPLDVRKTIER